jgi:alkanesulfonate monooxygenase SsuD/methylene tetrahydromethanopterin reductase-like flavin-dependent oxidoreductase (luciferase family)
MKYGLSVPQFDAFGDIHRLVDLAQEAEEVGWDGFFMVDPWVAMAAMAVQTKKIKLGPMVTPLARRRPWKLAREAVSIDHLSNGRLIMGVGLGAPEQWEFGFFGEETDAKTRAGKLDESLEIFQGLLSGELFSFQGEFYKLEEPCGEIRWVFPGCGGHSSFPTRLGGRQRHHC